MGKILKSLKKTKKGLQIKFCKPLFKMVPRAGVEPAQPLRPRDFKSIF